MWRLWPRSMWYEYTSDIRKHHSEDTINSNLMYNINDSHKKLTCHLATSSSVSSYYSPLLWKRWPSDELIFCENRYCCTSNLNWLYLLNGASLCPRCILITYFLATIFISVLLVAECFSWPRHFFATRLFLVTISILFAALGSGVMLDLGVHCISELDFSLS